MRHLPGCGRSAPAGLLLVVALLLALLPVLPAGAQSDGAVVSYSYSGFDTLSPGEPGAVTVTARVDDPGGLDAEAPLRFVGTLTAQGEPVAGTSVGYRGPDDSSFAGVSTDEQGRFFYPPASRAPLTLAGSQLSSADGEVSTLELTLPEGEDFRLDVQLVETGEGVGDVVRLSGSNRFETAAAISAATFGSDVPVAYVATGVDFPDALTGGPAASLTDGPILLVGTDFIPDVTAAELERLSPGRIEILGGTAAVDAGVEAALAGLTSGSVGRLFGSDRFGTAADVATSVFAPGLDVAYIATGGEFPDALSGGAAAALGDGPVLLTLRDQLPTPTVDALRALEPGRIVILGGTGVIGEAVADQLAELTDGDVARYFGATRFETSASVSANAFDASLVNTVYLATGLNFPDALSGVPAAGQDEAPLLLVTDQQIPDAVRDELERLRAGAGFQQAGGGLRVVVLGGTGVVSQAVEDELAQFVRSDAPDLDDAQTVGEPDGTSFVVDPDPPSPSPSPPPPPPPPTPEPGRIAGTVTAAGGDDPIAGATVTASAAGGEPAGSDTTAANGTYEIDGLAAGDYEVTATADSFESEAKDARVTAEDTTIVDFALVPTPPRATSITLTPEADSGPAGDDHTLTATVTDQYDEPFRDAAVRFVLDDEGSPDSTTDTAVLTGADGTATFTFTNGTADVTNEITACTNGEASAPADCDGEVLYSDTATRTWGAHRPQILFAQSRSDNPHRVILIYSTPLHGANGPLEGAESQFTLVSETTTVTATSVTKVDGQHVHVFFNDTIVEPGQTVHYRQNSDDASKRIKSAEGLDARTPDDEIIEAQPNVSIQSPTQVAPVDVTAGDSFDIVFSTDIAGTYQLDFRPADGSGWTLFIDGTGDASVGANTVTVTVPSELGTGTYDIRARVTSADEHTGQRREDDAMNVAAPPPPS